MSTPLPEAGFTLVELLMVIVLLTILAVTAVIKWPTGMDDEAAVQELKRSIRYAQHLAVTRAWSSGNGPWGIMISGNRYFVGRSGAGCVSDCGNADCADEQFCNRALLDDSGLTLSAGVAGIYFNGLGEPIDASGTLLASTVLTVNGSRTIVICRETGFVQNGGSCP